MPTRHRSLSKAAPKPSCAVKDCSRDYRAVGHCGFHLPLASELARAAQVYDTVCGGVWVEDIEFMLANGCTWEQVVGRVDRTAGALEMGLKRAGRSDLTARLKWASEQRGLVAA